MTLAPIESWHLAKGVKGPAYKVGPRCANPQCSRWADHAHHIFRRSMLAGDYAWVEVNGKVFGNLTGLCHRCHDDITGNVGGHKARIWLDLEKGVFLYHAVHMDEGFTQIGPLDRQPPTPSSADRDERVLGPEATEEHCPFCGGSKRRARPSTSSVGPRRRRKTWTVSVPDDAEDGAEILDTFVDDIAALLGAGDWHERNRRYWALIHALAWTMQQREQFERDVKAAA